MGKKRAATAEPGPSKERRSKQKADQKGKAVSEVQSRRKGGSEGATRHSQPPIEDRGKFLVRPVAFEASVAEHWFDAFPILGRLVDKGWGPMFYGSYQADEGRVRAFYLRIRDPELEPLGFNLVVGGKSFPIGVKNVASVLGVPLGEVQINERNLETGQARDERTRFLCGRVARWNRGDQGQGLSSSNLTRGYRLLHRICTHNVYPRVGNRNECSRYMVEFLYQVGRNANVCLPSVILHQMVRAARSKRKEVCLPFGRLVCQLAQLYGVGGSDGKTVPIELLDDDVLNKMKMGPKQRQARIDQYGDAAEEEEEESDGSDEEEDETESEGGAEGAERVAEIEEVGGESLAAPDVVGRLGALDSRMAKIEESQARIEENQARIKESQAKQEKWNKKMYRAIKALICCSKGEEAPPLSPDSDE